MPRREASSVEKERRCKLTNWVQSDPEDDVQSLLIQAREVRTLFLEELAERIEKPLNEFLAEQPHSTFHEKTNLARWLNSALEAIGLCLQCPKTKLPGILVGNHGDYSEHGRFQVNVFGPNGERKVSLSSVELPLLHIIPRPMTIRTKSGYRRRNLDSPDNSR
jgi:hypothetical protein